MYNSIIIKSALIFYMLCAGFIVWFLWKNPGAPNSLQNVGVICASIIPILILISPLFNAEKMEKDFVYTLFFDYTEKKVTPGNAPFGDRTPGLASLDDVLGVYHFSYFPMYTNISTSIAGDPKTRDECRELFEAKGMDMIEKGILETLIRQFMRHWDIEQEKHRSPLGTSIEWSNNSKLEKTTIKLNQLKSTFKHNQIISQPGVLVGLGLTIPKGSLHVELSRNGATRTLVFNNSHVCLKIMFWENQGGIISREINGVLLPAPDEPNRFWAQCYRVSMSMDIKKTKVHSPDINAYKRWFTNITDSLSVFDWQVIEKKIKDGK